MADEPTTTVRFIATGAVGTVPTSQLAIWLARGYEVVSEEIPDALPLVQRVVEIENEILGRLSPEGVDVLLQNLLEDRVPPSDQREQPGGYAGLDDDGLLFEERLPERLSADGVTESVASYIANSDNPYVFDVDNHLQEDDDDPDWMTTQIQQLIDEAESLLAGGFARTATIRFGSGKVYDITELGVGTGIRLDGQGSRLRFRSGSNFSGIYTRGAHPEYSGGDGETVVTDIEVSGFLIDNQGNLVTGNRSQLIRIERASRVRVLSNRFVNVGPKVTVRIDAFTSDCVVDSNYMYLPDDTPFQTFENAQGVSCHSDTVDNYGGGGPTSISGGPNNALTFTEPTNVSRRHFITRNWIFGGTHGISLWGAQDCTVAGNYLENQSHRSIIMSPVASENLIVNNKGKDFGQAFILMAWGSHHNTVRNNKGRTSKTVGEMDGIRCSFGAHSNDIDGNTVRGTGGRGFRDFTGGQKNTWRNNKAIDCRIGFQVWSLNTDTGYFQPTGCPPTLGWTLANNTVINADIAYQIRQSKTTAAATTPNVPIGIGGGNFDGNFAYNIAVATFNFVEDSPPDTSQPGGWLTDIHADGNWGYGGAASGSWQLPRKLAHFRHFRNAAQTDVGTSQAVASGEATFDRGILLASLTMTGGTMRTGAFTARKTESISAVRLLTTGTAAGATPTLIRMAVFEVNEATGAWTEVASTVNDTSLFSVANTAYTKLFAAPFLKYAGRRYEVVALVVTSATAPTLAGNTGVGPSSEYALSPRLCATMTGLSDLPSAPTESTVSNTTGRLYAALVP